MENCIQYQERENISHPHTSRGSPPVFPDHALRSLKTSFGSPELESDDIERLADESDDAVQLAVRAQNSLLCKRK